MDWSIEGVANTWENDGSIGSWSKPKWRFDVEEIGGCVTEVGIWSYSKQQTLGFERPGRNSFLPPRKWHSCGFHQPQNGGFHHQKIQISDANYRVWDRCVHQSGLDVSIIEKWRYHWQWLYIGEKKSIRFQMFQAFLLTSDQTKEMMTTIDCHISTSHDPHWPIHVRMRLFAVI